MGSLVSGIFGGGSSPGQQAQMNAIHGSVGDYQTYRQEMAQALLNTLNTANSAYQGANNALETAWGAPTPKTGWGPGQGSFRGPSSQPMPTPQPSNVGSALGGALKGGSAMGNAPQGRSDPFITAGQAVLDPGGLFTKGIGGLF